ncbi:MAG: PQQ-dependent sugar dehydrogenase [Candidatus Limnocylindria bacterium]
MRLPPRARLMLPLAAVVVVVVAGGPYLLRGSGPPLRTTVIQDGLEVPWGIAFPPDGRMLVTERPGRILVFAGAAPDAELHATVHVPDVRAEREAGLMGIAVDHDLETNPFVYVCASRDADGEAGPAPWSNELLRYRLGDGGDLELDTVLFDEPMPAAIHHNGCAVVMDEARHIWLTMGDGNISAAQVNPAQDPTALSGKILRLNADGSVPNDNPVLPGADAPTAAWSMGHRNPQGLAMREDGLVLAPEHGTDTHDEINRIEPGGNYGWACWIGEGTAAQAQDGPGGEGCEPASAYLPPLWSSGTPTIATSGGVFLEGEAWGDWEGSLVVSTLKDEDLRRFEVLDGGDRLEPRDILLDGEFGRLRAVVIGPDGALYVSTSNETSGDDRIIRVERPAG